MYTIDKLDNGIRVIIEKIPYVNSASIGIIVDTGSINENEQTQGISHFIEHMLFKGTSNRTAREIAEVIDNIGGQLNAFTGKESTCYYTKVLSNHLNIAIDVLSDMILNSLFSTVDIEKEKSVIIEEINMYLDTPEEISNDLLNEIMFENTSLAHPIIGTEKTINKFTKENIVSYFKENYIPENMVISIAGNVDIKESIKVLNEKFGGFNPTIQEKKQINNIYVYSNKIEGLKKDTEQLHLTIGMEGVSVTSDNVEPLLVVNNIFGGSVSSRLFQKIREELGLAYNIESFLSSYRNTGQFGIYTGLHPKQLLKTVETIANEMEDIRKNLITKEELNKSKEQLKGSYVLDMEGTFNRMFENGKSISLFERILSPAEILQRLDDVKMDHINHIVKLAFDKSKINIAYVGKVSNKEKTENKIKEILFN